MSDLTDRNEMGLDLQTIGRRLATDARRFGIPAKAIGAELWPDQREPRFTWYKKTACRGSQFELHELGPAADAISRLGRKIDGSPLPAPPRLYPLVDWDLAEGFENWLSLRGDKTDT